LSTGTGRFLLCLATQCRFLLPTPGEDEEAHRGARRRLCSATQPIAQGVNPGGVRRDVCGARLIEDGRISIYFREFLNQEKNSAPPFHPASSALIASRPPRRRRNEPRRRLLAARPVPPSPRRVVCYVATHSGRTATSGPTRARHAVTSCAPNSVSTSK